MTVEQATGLLFDAIVSVDDARKALPVDSEFDSGREECRRMKLHLTGLVKRIEGSERYLRERVKT
jgi:hypothetical protein